MTFENPLILKNLIFWLFTQIWISGFIRGQDITLDSVEIFTKHEWFKLKNTVYFQCKGENKTILPDVTNTGILYTFRGQESWQPLTEISGEKCKRCGFYEQGSLISDKELDEWEVCPSDFSATQIYVHSKEKEMNATFLCHGCTQLTSSTSEAMTGSKPQDEEDIGVVVIIAIVGGVMVATLVVVGAIFVLRHSQRKKKQQDQARFMKLFEESDELEDDLGLDPVV